MGYITVPIYVTFCDVNDVEALTKAEAISDLLELEGHIVVIGDNFVIE